MGTSYHLYCLDCQEEYDPFGGRNRDTHILQDILSAASKVAEVAPVLLAQRLELLDGSYLEGKLDLPWFIKHGNHRLRVRSEYGKCVDECGKYTKCSACGHEHYRCLRLVEHEGPCGPKRDDEPKETENAG